MLFQINRPSIPSIRAKFLIEKLRNIPQNSASISLCATGRTGSGKTTLGNRLVGIDYFMPSTGEQDCTDEVNLVEFSNGLKYFDLPGVASKRQLENYNRAALGIEQRGKFQTVNNLTLAKYGIGKNSQKNSFTVPEFRENQILAPDLILYMIAADKQFLDVDCLYLGDLLSHYSQVIYIFNMFADKETGSLYASEQNIQDVARRIKEVHTDVLGTKTQPIIVPVNCWTGEGISELLTSSYEVLGSKKGRLFEELIEYQQQKTPDEYLRQVKQELFRLFAYVACQKPEGTYTCDQPIHKACHALWDFLVDSQISENISSNIIEQVNSLVTQIIAETPGNYSNQALESFEEKIYYFNACRDSIQEGIEYLNEEINSRLLNWQNAAIEYRDQAIELVDRELQSRGEVIESIEQEVKSVTEEYNYIIETIDAIQQKMKNHAERRDALVEDLQVFDGNLESRLKRHNTEVDDFNDFAIKLSNRIDRYNGRISRLKARSKALKSTIKKINKSGYSVSNSTIYSIEEERESINEEIDDLDSEETKLDRKIRKRDQRGSEIESEKKALEKMIEQRAEKVRSIEFEEQAIEEARTSGISQIKELEKVEKAVQAKFRLHSEKIKDYQDAREFNLGVLQYFQEEFDSIEKRKSDRIEEMNSQIAKVSSIVAQYQAEEIEALENNFESCQEEMENCLERMWDFREEIDGLINEIKRCIILMGINHFVIEVIVKSTNHYFDNVGECEYKGSEYQHFSKEGVTMLLIITHMITSKSLYRCKTIAEMENRYKAWVETISRKIVKLPKFPIEPTESIISSFLEANIDLIFYPSFDEPVKKFAL